MYENGAVYCALIIPCLIPVMAWLASYYLSPIICCTTACDCYLHRSVRGQISPIILIRTPYLSYFYSTISTLIYSRYLLITYDFLWKWQIVDIFCRFIFAHLFIYKVQVLKLLNEWRLRRLQKIQIMYFVLNT